MLLYNSAILCVWAEASTYEKLAVPPELATPGSELETRRADAVVVPATIEARIPSGAVDPTDSSRCVLGLTTAARPVET
jgi:hypothetical protein